MDCGVILLPSFRSCTLRGGAYQGELVCEYQLCFLVCHFIAPVMPFAKLFWRARKMIAVGSVQISTPSISMP